MAARVGTTPARPSFWVTPRPWPQLSDGGAPRDRTTVTASISRRLGRSSPPSSIFRTRWCGRGHDRSHLDHARPPHAESAQGSRGTRRFSSSTQFWISTNSTDDPLAGVVVGARGTGNARRHARHRSRGRAHTPWLAANVKSGSGFENSKLSLPSDSDRHGHDAALVVQVHELTPAARPTRPCTACGRDLPPSCAHVREGANVHFVSARFVRVVCDRTTVGRDQAPLRASRLPPWRCRGSW